MNTIWVLTLAYLMGSIPFGILFSRVFRGKHPRTGGSGNIGFTNVYRVNGPIPAVLTLAGDVGKGTLAAYLGNRGGLDLATACGLMAILGHCYPLMLKFQGGKAVATSYGALIILAPQAGGLSFTIWVLTVLISKNAALGALVSFTVLPGILWWMDAEWYLLVFSLLVAALIFTRHQDNIRDLIGRT